MTMRLIRYVKRGPGAFVGLALLLVLGVLGCTAYGDSLRSQITPEQAVRAYVQLIIDGKYSEAEKVIPARDKQCNGRLCRVVDDISELRVEAPQLLDVTVSKECGERNVRCIAKVRLLVGGVEQEYQLSLTRDESEGSPVTGWWHLDGALVRRVNGCSRLGIRDGDVRRRLRVRASGSHGPQGVTVAY